MFGVVQEEISRQLDETILDTSSSIFIIRLLTEDDKPTVMQFEEEVLTRKYIYIVKESQVRN